LSPNIWQLPLVRTVSVETHTRCAPRWSMSSLSFRKSRAERDPENGKAAERNLVEIVTPRDKPSSAQSIISPPSREEHFQNTLHIGGEMKRTGGGRPTHLPDDFDLQREQRPLSRNRGKRGGV
jgi:hypothetical protein